MARDEKKQHKSSDLLVEQRLAAALVELVERGLVEETGGTWIVPLEQADLAALIGALGEVDAARPDPEPPGLPRRRPRPSAAEE